MSSADVVRKLYAAFETGDVPAVLGLMAPDIVWNEAENFLYADRNPYKGPQAILEGVFMRIGGDFENFAVKPEEIIESGDTVVMFGRYTGTFKATGKAINLQASHVWRVKDGKVTQFQQYVDTLAAARAAGR
ncbi:MAG TPA: nuclear transport factor 2 family protein [Vitreimonas sp.]|jgi:ketosteroid isomerase-like protein|nr:nuclear transport factor 2 family protein [Vitreimonas sp.]